MFAAFRWIINILLLLLLVFAALSALGNMIGLPQQIASLGSAVSAIGWFWLVTPVLLPLLLGAVALLGSRKRPGLRPLLLLLAVALTALWQLEILYLIPPGTYFQ